MHDKFDNNNDKVDRLFSLSRKIFI